MPRTHCESPGRLHATERLTGAGSKTLIIKREDERMGNPGQAGDGGRVIAVTLFVTAFLTLLLQVLLTRILSVVMWYHFTFAVISVSLLGIAAGSMFSYRRACQVPPPTDMNGFAGPAGGGLVLLALAVLLPVFLLTGTVAT